MLDFGGGAGGNVANVAKATACTNPSPHRLNLQGQSQSIYRIYQMRLLHSRKLPPVTNSQAFLRSTIRKIMQSGGRNIHPPAAAVKLRSRERPTEGGSDTH